jgi:hypothetical protein
MNTRRKGNTQISGWMAVLIVILGNAAILTGCLSDDHEDLDPPGEVSDVSVVPTNGGGIISYTLPPDEDLHFVRATYTNALGNEVFRVASFYENTLQIDGFNDTLTHSVLLQAVDRHRNYSEGVSVEFNPLVSHIQLVKESVTLEPALGGVMVNWENVAAKQVFVYLFIENETFSDQRILSSSAAEENFMVRGLDSVYYDFSIQVEDFDGNRTDKVFKESVKPLFEQKIDKSSWTLVPSLSVDGNAWEGVTENFWDDVIDTHESDADNSYFIINRDDNGGTLNYPLDIVMDFNKKAIVNRFTVWQRAYWYSSAESQGVSAEPYYYQNENMRSFDLWASNDLSEWLLLGSFDIGDPKDDDGNIPPEKLREALDGHEFVLDEISDPFRYLKFSITSSYGSETNVYGSEITLYGIDNAD